MFDYLVNLTEPICRRIDKDLSDSFDPYKAAYKSKSPHAFSNPVIRQMYINGHFCYVETIKPSTVSAIAVSLVHLLPAKGQSLFIPKKIFTLIPAPPAIQKNGIPLTKYGQTWKSPSTTLRTAFVSPSAECRTKRLYIRTYYKN